MERTITLSELRKTVDEAYEQFKSLKEGTVSEKYTATDEDLFGITVVTSNGDVISKGDSTTRAALGKTVLLPTAVTLLSQNSLEDLIKKAGLCHCSCQVKETEAKLPKCAMGIRATSAVEPTGDSDGKYDVLINNMINLMGSAPVLDDQLYKALMTKVENKNVADLLTAAGFYLYDDAKTAINVFVKEKALTADTRQLATMAATVAADGFNPVTKQHVFDGSISASVVSMMAMSGAGRQCPAWMLRTGLPALSSKSGILVGAMPGAFGVAAYSPRLGATGISVKAYKALAYIMQKLQSNVHASARVRIDADK